MILDDDDTPPNPLKAFDAFPKVNKSYVHSRSSRGGIVSLGLLCIVAVLTWTETVSWWRGTEVMRVSVEQGVGHGMQLNVDVTVAMACEDLEVNVLDATGDRILAGEELTKEPAGFVPGKRRTQGANSDEEGAIYRQKIQQILAAANEKRGKRKFRPQIARGGLLQRLRKDVIKKDSCRIYGQLEIHKCQGDFHITARGHGYQSFGGDHLDHDKINFTHIIDEFSFGEYFPKIVNPLDETSRKTTEHMYRFQYFLSVVPTVYIANDFTRKVIETNQYAVTEQSHSSAGALGHEVPGIFFKYDVESLQLTIMHGHLSTYRFLMHLVAVIGGVAVCTEWLYKAFDAATIRLERKSNSRKVSAGDGLLNGLLEKESLL